MKKITIAALGISLLTSVGLFAQNTSSSTDTMGSMSGTSTGKKHHKKMKKSSTATTSTSSTT